MHMWAADTEGVSCAVHCKEAKDTVSKTACSS